MIHSAQQTRHSSCGNGFYAGTLPILGDAPSGGMPFLSPDLSASASIDKSGYRFTMARGAEATAAFSDGCNPTGVAAALFSSYYATNRPVAVNITGRRWFWTNTQTQGVGPPAAGTPLQ